MEREHPQVELKRSACPYCKDPVHPGDAKAACDACMAWHHQECWSDHGGCSACGAAQGVGEGVVERAPAPAADPPVCAASGCSRPVQQRVLETVYVNLPEQGTQHAITTLCHRHAGTGLRLSQSQVGALGVLLLGIASICVILVFYTEELWPCMAAGAMSYVMGLAALAQRRNRRGLLEQLQAHEKD